MSDYNILDFMSFKREYNISDALLQILIYSIIKPEWCNSKGNFMRECNVNNVSVSNLTIHAGISKLSNLDIISVSHGNSVSWKIKESFEDDNITKAMEFIRSNI